MHFWSTQLARVRNCRTRLAQGFNGRGFERLEIRTYARARKDTALNHCCQDLEVAQRSEEGGIQRLLAITQRYSGSEYLTECSTYYKLPSTSLTRPTPVLVDYPTSNRILPGKKRRSTMSVPMQTVLQLQPNLILRSLLSLHRASSARTQSIPPKTTQHKATATAAAAAARTISAFTSISASTRNFASDPSFAVSR